MEVEKIFARSEILSGGWLVMVIIRVTVCIIADIAIWKAGKFAKTFIDTVAESISNGED